MLPVSLVGDRGLLSDYLGIGSGVDELPKISCGGMVLHMDRKEIIRSCFKNLPVSALLNAHTFAHGFVINAAGANECSYP